MARQSTNGRTVSENLRHLESKRHEGRNAEVRMSTCEWLPSKRQWLDDREAIAAARGRTEAVRIDIVAVRCDSCGYAHLTKRANAKPGTILEDTPIERDPSVLPLVGENIDARIKLLAGWLEENPEPSTQAITEQFGWHRRTVTLYMRELGWSAGKGRTARWSKDVEPPVEKPVDSNVLPMVKPTSLDASMARHPAALNAGWEAFPKLDSFRHMSLGDILDIAEALGVQIRVQTRRNP